MPSPETDDRLVRDANVDDSNKGEEATVEENEDAPVKDGLIRWQGRVICWGYKKKIVTRWFGVAVIALSVATLPVCIYVLRARLQAELHVVAWFVAGVFALLTLPVSVFGILLHLNHYNKPEIQRYILRIMWMPPIYGFACWFSLLFKTYSLYWVLLREFYEAYCIYSFTFFLMALLEDNKKMEEIEAKERADKIARGEPVEDPPPEKPKYGKYFLFFGERVEKPQKWSWVGPHVEPEHQDPDHPHMHHIFPLCCLPQWSMEPVANPDMPHNTDSHFAANCRYGVLLYVVIKICTSIATFITEHMDVYYEGEFRVDGGYAWCALIYNCAQLWAMYCLVLFYHTYIKQLARYRPFPKFCAIKAVVFFAFWQSVIIAGLVSNHYIEKPLETTYTEGQISGGLQDLIIAVEMFFAAWFHLYAFSHQDYKRRQDGAKLSVFQMIATIFDVKDVAHDLKVHAKVHVKQVKRVGDSRKSRPDREEAAAAGQQETVALTVTTTVSTAASPSSSASSETPASPSTASESTTIAVSAVSTPATTPAATEPVAAA